MAPWDLEISGMSVALKKDAECLTPSRFSFMSIYKILALITGVISLVSILPRLDVRVQDVTARTLHRDRIRRPVQQCLCLHGTSAEGSRCRTSFGTRVSKCVQCEDSYKLVSGKCELRVCKYDERLWLVDPNCKHVVCKYNEDVKWSSPACRTLETCGDRCVSAVREKSLFGGYNEEEFKMMRTVGCKAICDLWCPTTGSLQYHFNRDERFSFRRLRRPPSYRPSSDVTVKIDPDRRVCGVSRYDCRNSRQVGMKDLTEDTIESIFYSWEYYEFPGSRHSEKYDRIWNRCNVSN